MGKIRAGANMCRTARRRLTGIIAIVCIAQFPSSDVYPEIAANLGGGPRD